MSLLKVFGKIEVFPLDRERIKQKKKPFEEQTIVLKVDDDISKYYAWFLKKEWGLELEFPSFGTHVTVNNGSLEIPDVALKEEYLQAINGMSLIVDCNPEIYRVWEFFAMKVYSEQLNEIRQNLGLPLKEYFHITVGRIHVNAKKETLLKRVLE